MTFFNLKPIVNIPEIPEDFYSVTSFGEIYQCLTGKNKTHRGFIWKYKNSL